VTGKGIDLNINDHIFVIVCSWIHRVTDNFMISGMSQLGMVEY